MCLGNHSFDPELPAGNRSYDHLTLASNVLLEIQDPATETNLLLHQLTASPKPQLQRYEPLREGSNLR